ncbi:MAG: metallophosphoesterase [Clostridia bacterium]|nr:metallophosphoesterase [Clostridia bacterium]
MKIYAISDLHLDINNTKPMNVFGPVWENYLETIIQDWNEKVEDEDVVVLAGDFSWAMKFDEVVSDFSFLEKLKGYKIIIRGNHDYWWKSISSIRKALPEKCFALQNDAIKLGNYIFCGNRGWNVPEGQFNTDEDKRIYAREIEITTLSLKSAEKLKVNDEKIIFVTHFPPFNYKAEESQTTKLMEEYGVYKVIFGHLHGYTNPNIINKNINGINYYLTSCDIKKNKLTLIDE